MAITPEILAIVERALAEDIGTGDATTNSIVPPETHVAAQIVAKTSGVIAGLEIARHTFERLHPAVTFACTTQDGVSVPAGQTVAEIRGIARAILTAERTALNFMGRMSGIATRARQFVDAVAGTSAQILDTRKTAPNLRALDKMAVRLGGAQNHRFGLFDMVLIKDNHIDCAGSIQEAVARAQSENPDMTIEVEARTLQEMRDALKAGVDWIMLDNMSLDDLKQAVILNRGHAKLEASGNVALERVRQIAETGVNYISVGALTHSVQALDLTLLINRTRDERSP